MKMALSCGLGVKWAKVGEMSKQVYHTPSLTKFGSVKSLTRGRNGSNADSGQQAATKSGIG